MAVAVPAEVERSPVSHSEAFPCTQQRWVTNLMLGQVAQMQTATESLLATVRAGIARIKSRTGQLRAARGEPSSGGSAAQVIPVPRVVERPVAEGPGEGPLRDDVRSGEEPSVSTAPGAGARPDAWEDANTRGLDGRPSGESGPKNK